MPQHLNGMQGPGTSADGWGGRRCPSYQSADPRPERPKPQTTVGGRRRREEGKYSPAIFISNGTVSRSCSGKGNCKLLTYAVVRTEAGGRGKVRVKMAKARALRKMDMVACSQV